MENKCLNVIRSTKNKFQPWMLWVVGQFLLNNERQRFELWGRAYNFRARAPTERRIIPRESSGNALEGSIWLHLGFFRFFSFFKNIFDTELTSSPGYTPLVAIEKIAGEKRWKLFRWTGKPAGESARLSDRVAHAFCGKWCACSRNKRRQRRGWY